MALLIQKVILDHRWQPCTQFVRFRNRINIQRPRKPHYERAKVLHVCRPYYITPEEKKMPVIEPCLKPFEAEKKQLKDNPYRDLLAKEMLSWFNHSQMILFFHQNPINGDELFRARILFKRQNMCLRSYSKTIAKIALEGTKYETVLPLFENPLALAFSPEPQVAKSLKIDKKIPQLLLLAGIVDDCLLSKKEMVAYGKLPDLQTARAQLVGTLNAAAVQLVHNLNHHQVTLVGHLQKHIELQNPTDSPTAKEKETEIKIDSTDAKVDSQSPETKVDPQTAKEKVD